LSAAGQAPDPDRIAAYLRAHVTLRLLAELSDHEVRAAAPGPLSVQLCTPGGPRAHVQVRDGRISFRPRPRLFATVTLFFPRPRHLVTTLTGGKAPVIPVPGSPRFLTAIRAFRALSASLQAAFGDADRRPRLLLLATLYALEEVANRDPYVSARVGRMPAGVILVRVEGEEAIEATVTVAHGTDGRPRLTVEAAVRPEGATAGATAAARPETPRPNAILEFADRQAAVDLLTGAVSAAGALADRRVRLYGRLPMIQHLFPVLDRVSWYMGGSGG